MSPKKPLFGQPDMDAAWKEYLEHERRHVHDDEVVDALVDLAKAVKTVKKRPRKKK